MQKDTIETLIRVCEVYGKEPPESLVKKLLKKLTEIDILESFTRLDKLYEGKIPEQLTEWLLERLDEIHEEVLRNIAFNKDEE